MHLLKEGKGPNVFFFPSNIFLNAYLFRYLTTIWWLLNIKIGTPPPIIVALSVSWPHRGADTSLAAMSSKVYFTVHLRLQDCNTWMGIRAVMTDSREQWKFLWWSEGCCGCRVHFTTLCKTATDISVPVSSVAGTTVRGIFPSSPGSGSKIGRILSFSAIINHSKKKQNKKRNTASVIVFIWFSSDLWIS